MKTRIIALVTVTVSFICFFQTILFAKETGFSDEGLFKRAFELGASLVVVKVQGRPSREQSNDGLDRMELKVQKLIIPGDLSMEDLKDTITPVAPMAFSKNLAIGHTYLLFISREIPYGFCWMFRDNYYEVNVTNQDEIEHLKRIAERAYRASSIFFFRNTKPDESSPLPDLDSNLLNICKRFRKYPDSRTDYGRSIWESDLGSPLTARPIISSITTYEVPKIKLSRGQVIKLLGQPTLKCGFTYFWRCGIEHKPLIQILERPKKDIDKSLRYYGVVTVRFGADEKTRYLRYTAYTDE